MLLRETARIAKGWGSSGPLEHLELHVKRAGVASVCGDHHTSVGEGRA